MFKDDKHIFIDKEAEYYKKLNHEKVECTLCPRECIVDSDERGYCGVRENRDGKYYTLVYGNPCAAHVDPIEKKPLFHFLPGTTCFSISTAGCNVNCKFCQNWQISQLRPEQTDNIKLFPDDVVRSAKYYNCSTIAYTYGEPTIFYEYMLDTAKKGCNSNVRSVMISAGYIKEEPMKELCNHLDAVKIDLKAITEKYYKEVINGELKPVLSTLELLKKIGIWFEIVYLVVSTLNDSEKEFKDLSKWIKNNLGPDVPIHFSRFYPQYLLKNLPATPVKTLEKAVEIARGNGLNYVYIGNIPNHEATNTYCPQCKEVVIERLGYAVKKNYIKDGKCNLCNKKIPGIWK